VLDLLSDLHAFELQLAALRRRAHQLAADRALIQQQQASQQKEQASSRGEEVLPIFLHHCQVLPWATLCQLLCASRVTAAAVHASCVGTRQLVLKPGAAAAQQPGMFNWLRKHAVLLHSLEHPTDQSTWSDTDVESAATAEHCSWKVAAALAAAAAALPGGLLLRCLHTYSLPVLSAASCSTLTSLHLSLTAESLSSSVTMAAAASCISGVPYLPLASICS
jgi:hypothetical protein